MKFGLFFIGVLSFFLNQCSSSDRSNLKANTSNLVVTDVKVTTLSTMLANQGVGEWGYAALVEVDGKKILFDTGRFPETVLNNAAQLGIDLSSVEEVFLSHNHGDHTGGLLSLRQELKKKNPKAISVIHVAEGIFAQRVGYPNRMLDLKEALEEDGVTFNIYTEEKELYPGVWITGPIERTHPEKNYGTNTQLKTKQGFIEDNIPEDQSLVINTDKGYVIIAGCGHAGIINTLEYVKSKIENKNTYAIIGGFHLLNATDEQLEWTAGNLNKFGVKKIIGSHCTGLHALYTLKEKLDLDRSSAVVGSIGDHFDVKYGIKAGLIAK